MDSMEQKLVRIMKTLPIVVIVLGVIVIAFVASSYFIGVSRVPSWGTKRGVVALLGITVIGLGVFLALPFGQRFIKELFVPSVESQRPVSELQIAIWFGLLTGLIEASVLSYRNFFQGSRIYMSAHFEWMVLLGDVSVFLILGLVLMLTARLMPRLISFQVRIVVLTFLGFFIGLLLLPEVHLIASLILSIGLAIQIASFVMKHQSRYYWAVRWTTPMLFADLLLLLNGTLGWLLIIEWRATGKAPLIGPEDPFAFPLLLDAMLVGGIVFQIIRRVRPQSPRDREHVDALENDSTLVNKLDSPKEHPIPNADFTRREFLIGAGAGAIVGMGSLAIASQTLEMINQSRGSEKISRGTSDSPNVLLIVLDTVRAQSLSLYGYNRMTTPQLERLAKKGVTFQWAFSPSSWTLPSHGTIFTGRWHHEQSVGWSLPLDGSLPTLAEVLRGMDYATAGFVGNNLYCSHEVGLNRGFGHYEDYPV